MDEKKPEQPPVSGELDVEDLDVDETAAETVKGGGGGDYSADLVFKRPPRAS